MIVNVQNKKDVITVDFRIRQIRYVTDIANQGGMQFYDMSHSDVEGYEYLINNNQKSFLECLTEDSMNNFEGVSIDQADLKIITDEEYLKLCNGD